ncbi:MAG: M28 family peptidase [Planctomycetota bacterium]
MRSIARDVRAHSGRVCLAFGAALVGAFLPACSSGPSAVEAVTVPVPAFVSSASTADPVQLRHWHDLTSSVVHHAGSPGDEIVIDNIAAAFEAMGLVVERHEFWAYLGEPSEASVSIVQPVELDLPTKESPVEGDPYSLDADHPGGWNAYSASGVAEADVVYVNHGRKQDFEALAAAGVSLDGKIAIARYGGNFRGYKAKFAEEAGAAGLIIYTDPANDGRGDPWPIGGWANSTSIQRGSLKTLPYAGDALTPGVEATRRADRLNPLAIALPRIPVQPIGWGAAREILSRMSGASVDELGLDDWQGGLGFEYRVEGGPDLVVRLEVDQDKSIVRTENVIGYLRGTSEPEKLVVVGSHHDAWGYGASDPGAGTICVLEAARLLSQRGPMRRTIAFAAWGAEEHGIVGSTEWVEGRRAALERDAIAYINLDGAATGPSLRVSASPPLLPVIAHAANSVRGYGEEFGGVTLYEQWAGREFGVLGGEPVGDLGGGSDHVGFLCHAGIPSAGLFGRGADGVSYHTMYDNLAWYRATVGEDYESARMITELSAALLRRLASEPVLPLDPSRYGVDARRHLLSARAIAEEKGLSSHRLAELDRLVERAGEVRDALDDVLNRARESGQTEAVNEMIIAADRAWIDPEGLPERPWYRNLFAAPDQDSGYAAWMLPALRYAIDRDDAEAFDQAVEAYDEVFDRLLAVAARLRSIAWS